MRVTGSPRAPLVAWIVITAAAIVTTVALGAPSLLRAASPPRPAPTLVPPGPEAARAATPATSAAHGTVDGAGEIPFADAHAAAVRAPSAPDAWGGPRTGQEATLSDRVVKYEIAASLDPAAHTIDGHERMTWRNRSDRPVKTIFLHLYLNAFAGADSTFYTEHRNLGFDFRSDVGTEKGQWGHIDLGRVAQNGVLVPWRYVHPDGGPKTDRTVVRFDLPEPVAPGASTTVDIDFHDQLPRVVARTGWWGSFHLVGQWFPKIGVLELAGERGATAPRWNVHEFHLHSEFYADWGEYDVKMTVPRSFQVASAGEEVGEPVEKNGLVTHHFVQADVHDFAWMAADDFAPPLEGSYDGPGSPHVKVRVFYPPQYRASAAPSLQATIDSLRYFSNTLGPYPYKTSTCVIPPYNATEAGGMEYQTFFTGWGSSSVEPHTIVSDYIIDFVVIHEFGHGYFYGLLASNEFEEPLLDEGLNEYWDSRMLRARGQDVHLTTPLLKKLGISPMTTPFDVERVAGSFESRGADPIAANAWDRLSSGSYESVYSRTAIVFHDLEERLGHDALERAFKLYYARWRFRHPSIADLEAALAEGSGDAATVHDMFARQVYDYTRLDTRVQSLESKEALPQPGLRLVDGKWVEDTRESLDKQIDEQRKQWAKAHPDAKKGEGPFPYRTLVTLRREGPPSPETVVVTFEDGSTERLRWDDQRRWARLDLERRFRATSAEIDPERRFLLDSDKLNDGRLREPRHAASRRWTGDLAALLEVLYSLVAVSL